MPIAEYMRLCLTHPQYGYYINRDPLGAGGDFVTSPEISQMFGELIGLWMAAVWQQMGAPENVRVDRARARARHVDARRVAGGESGGRISAPPSCCIWSRSARRCSRCSSGGWKSSTCRSYGTTALEDVPGGPSIIIANEFIDALPVHQAVKQAGRLA